MGSEASRRRISRKTTIESLEDRQMFSADPLSGLLGGGIQRHSFTEPPLEVHGAPVPEHDGAQPADFWYDRDFEREVDQLLGDVDQSLSSAHGLSGLTQARQNYGFTGAGQTVAIIDSGIAYDHLALGGGFGASYRVVGGWDFTEENDWNPYDEGPAGSHGTHVSGIVGGDTTGTTSDGVAPGVDLVGLRVFNDQGAGYFSWVEKALRWVHTNRNSYENPITAVNLSLGTGWNSASLPSWAMLEEEFAQLEADGIFISVSAGNSFTTYNSPGLSYPAASSHVVPVMSLDDNGSLSYFSQRHTRAIAAPGRSILSTVPDYVGNQNGVTDDWANFSGTSMAAPYVAGASVIVREAMQFVGQTNITEWTINNHMLATADTFVDAATNLSYKRLNVQSAINALLPTDDYGSTSGTAYSLGTVSGDRSISGLIGTVSDKDFFTFTAGATGTVNLTVSGTHYLEPSVTVTGSTATLEDGLWSFDVVAGQSYTISVETAAGKGIGYYDAALTVEESFEQAPVTVKTIVRGDGLVFSLDSEGWISINGYRLWENTRDFALGNDGTVYWQSVDGPLAHRLSNGTWKLLNHDTTKFAVRSDGTVFSLDSAGWISVNGYRTWENTKDFALTVDGKIYWQATNQSFACRGVDGVWKGLGSDVTKFLVRSDGVVFSLDTDNWVSIDGSRVWENTQDFWLSADGTIYWQGTNSSLARRVTGGTWETLSLDTIKFAVRHDGAVLTLSSDGDVCIDGVRSWTNVTNICADNAGRLVVECANGSVHRVADRFFASRAATVASSAVDVQGGQSSGGSVNSNSMDSLAALNSQSISSVHNAHLRATPRDYRARDEAHSALAIRANAIRFAFVLDHPDASMDVLTEQGRTADICEVAGDPLGPEDASTVWNAVDLVYGRIGDLP